MAGVSEIEWTDVTWNPVAGCTLASAGCTNCYAMRMAARLQAMGHDKYKGTTRKSGDRYVWLAILQNAWLGTSVESQDVVERVGQLAGITGATLFVSFEPLIGMIADIDLRKVHWAIVGGESGPRARPMAAEWVDRLHEICERDDVAFFFKQWGGRNKKAAGRELHGQTYDAFPIELEA